MTIENKEESAKLWILVFLYKTPSDAQELAYHGCSTMIRGKFNGKEFSDLLTNMIDEDLIMRMGSQYRLTLNGILHTQNTVFNVFDKLIKSNKIGEFINTLKESDKGYELIQNLSNVEETSKMEEVVKKFSVQGLPIIKDFLLVKIANHFTEIPQS